MGHVALVRALSLFVADHKVKIICKDRMDTEWLKVSRSGST